MSAERDQIVRSLRAMAGAETRAAKQERGAGFLDYARTHENRAFALKDAANRIAANPTMTSKEGNDE